MGGVGLSLGMKMSGIGMRIGNFGRMSFDAEAVMRAVNKSERQVLSGFGSFVRTKSRQSIKKAKPGKLSDLPPELREKYEPQRDASGRFIEQKTKDGKPPKIPPASSKPGDPPVYHTKAIKVISFAVDPRRHSVIIGPEKLPRAYPDEAMLLEYGGTTTRKGRGAKYRARPFMRPAAVAGYDEAIRKWRNSLKG